MAALGEDKVAKIYELWDTGRYSKVAIGQQVGASDVVVGKYIRKRESGSNGKAPTFKPMSETAGLKTEDVISRIYEDLTNIILQAEDLVWQAKTVRDGLSVLKALDDTVAEADKLRLRWEQVERTNKELKAKLTARAMAIHGE